MIDDLKERYLYAATRRLPARIRKDVEAELNGLIADMLEARCGDVAPEERDLRVVLAELGTPAELAARYNPHGHQALISGVYYLQYCFVLRIALAAVAFGLTVASLVTFLTGDMASPFVAALQWLGSVVFGSLMAFGFVTLLFAIFERKGVPMDMGDGLDNLPPAPSKEARIPPSEAVFGIIVAVLFSAVFLASPQIVGGFLGEGQWVPAFHAAAVRALWLLVVTMTALGVFKDAVKLYEGRYTRRLAVAVAATNLASGALTVAFFGNRSLYNTAFFNDLESLLTKEMESAAFPHPLWETFRWGFVALLLLELLADTIVTAVKAYRYDR